MKGKKILTMILAAFVAFGFTGCGTVLQEFDPNKIQIKVSLYDGGYGTAWLDSVIEEFEAKHEGYEIVPLPSKTEESNILNTFIAGAPSADIYFTSGINGMQQMITGGYLLDLSDVYNTKADGESGKTIRAKLQNASDYETAFSATESYKQKYPGIYALPYGYSIDGFVYDHDLFVDKGWLYFADPSDQSVLSALDEAGIEYTAEGSRLKFVSAPFRTNYEAGDFILRAGKDGKYGTYDDGQPQTMAEFSDMISKIGSAGYYSFVWSGAYVDYTDGICDALLAQYEGVDNYKALVQSEEGYKYTGKTASLQDYVISDETAYRMYEMDGFSKVVNFCKDYIATNYLPVSEKNSTSHTDAQNNYLYSYRSDAPDVAMLIEGIWWENEARATMNTLGAGRRYGERDYRFLLYPEMDGQRGIDGEGNGTVFAATDTGVVFAYRSSDETKNQLMKEFIAMTTSDKVLKEFTKTTGAMRPFSYEMSDADLAEMTPFGRFVWDLYQDTENISIVRKHVWLNTSKYQFSSRGVTFFTSEVARANMTFGYPVETFTLHKNRNVTPSEYVEGILAHRRANWSTYLADIERLTKA